MTMKSFSTLQPDDETRYLGGFESNRMPQDQFSKWVKYLLLFALLVVFISGFAILGIGIWAHESEYSSRQLSSLIGVTLYQVDAYMMIGCGACIIIITVLGLCGVCTQYKCIMGLHLWLLAFLAMSLFVAGILGYVLIGELENKVRAKMEETVRFSYGIDLSNPQNHDITTTWDRIQQSFQCCGVFGDINSTTSWAIYKDSEWFKKGAANGTYVPASCCDYAYKKYMDQCTGLTDTPEAPPRHGPPVSVNMMSLNYTLYTYGCFDKFEGYLRGTGIVIGTTAIVIGVFLLIEMVLSICMYRLLK